MAKPTHGRQEAPESSYAWLYLWEMENPAWRALNVVERVLLIHLRALHRPGNDDRVSLSVEEAVCKLGVSTKRIQNAFRVLDARGWVKEVPGGPRGSRTFLLLSLKPEQ